MFWLQSLDTELFRFLNLKLVNPVFDQLMPFISGGGSTSRVFYLLLGVAAVILIARTPARGSIFVLVMASAIALTDGFVIRNLKHAIGRPRPFVTMADVHQPEATLTRDAMVTKPKTEAVSPTPKAPEGWGYTSMPSGHSANWFSATMVAFLFYRRTLWFMLPAACMVAFSRIYNGVHYPGDVLAGGILGAGCGTATVLCLSAIWTWVGAKWFPLWHAAVPSLLGCPPRIESPDSEEYEPIAPARGVPRQAYQSPHVSLDQHWLRLSFVVIAALLVARLAYIASHTIELGEDEAYQWLWSKHLALSYYSKPPLIAYTQFLGTSLWGDNAFGVRFFSPCISSLLAFLIVRFFARIVNARAAFFLLLIITASPLMAVGSVLMTIDPLSVLFWTAAMLAGWRAIQSGGTLADWSWVGLWMGLGFLSKYTALFQLLCWVVFFSLWAPARKHLSRPGPYVALLISVLCATPVLVWNSQHQWITITHVSENAGVGTPWHPTLRYLLDFLGAEFGLLNPVFFVAMIWAAIAFWRRGRHDPRLVYFFSMGAPVFLAYFLHSFRSRILPNWIAPSVLPLMCLMVLYWDTRWRLGTAKIEGWLVGGLSVGFVMVIFGHNTDLIEKLTGYRLSVNMDPLHRVREWSGVARVAGEARKELVADGKPVFIIADHYGLVGEITFYLPEARTNLLESPMVFYRSSPIPQNQFYFWPGYASRKGDNAIFIRELDRSNFQPRPPPAFLESEFESVVDLGVRTVLYHNRVIRPLQIFACRGLR